ncbi:MAG: hypothetical protein HRU76_09185 [Phycisphaeraceae bacterium]|nr:hypothetical protein [Phycisphaerales bacterium]QOJ17744.1 MAG: hypothetical protein HRU76_09185 [Phycisphaeraceae bacterium]
MQLQIEGSSWVDLSTDTTVTADKAVGFQICPCKLRITLSGAGGGTSVKVRLAPAWQGWFPQEALPDTGASPPHSVVSTHFINEILSADGESISIKWRGGPGTFMAHAVPVASEDAWDGATVRIEFSMDSNNWVQVPGMELAFNADDAGGFHLGPCQLRAVMDDAGAETEVRVRVLPAYPGWLMDVAIPDTVED